MPQNKEKKLPAGGFYFNIIILSFSLFFMVMAYRISGFSLCGPGTFPLLSTTVMVLAILIVLIEKKGTQEDRATGVVTEIRQVFREVFTKDFCICTLLAVAYVALIQPIHFLPASFLFLTISVIYLKGSRPKQAVLISLGVVVFIYLIFLYFFKVLLP